MKTLKLSIYKHKKLQISKEINVTSDDELRNEIYRFWISYSKTNDVDGCNMEIEYMFNFSNQSYVQPKLL